jgi:hypothetical protein
MAEVGPENSVNAIVDEGTAAAAVDPWHTASSAGPGVTDRKPGGRSSICRSAPASCREEYVKRFPDAPVVAVVEGDVRAVVDVGTVARLTAMLLVPGASRTARVGRSCPPLQAVAETTTTSATTGNRLNRLMLTRRSTSPSGCARRDPVVRIQAGFSSPAIHR